MSQTIIIFILIAIVAVNIFYNAWLIDSMRKIESRRASVRLKSDLMKMRIRNRTHEMVTIGNGTIESNLDFFAQMMED